LRKASSVLLLIVIVIAGAAWYVARIPASPFDGASVDTSSAQLIQRGAYAARLGDCVACHSVPGKAPFSGGLKMATPLGSIFTTNITPDKDTGIGQYSLADFDRALRHGVARDGHRLYPAMPYPSYAKLGDDDVRALYAYFLHDVQPAHNENLLSDIPWPLNMRWPLAFWDGLFTESSTYRPKTTTATGAAADTLWNRGAYLVQGAGHCGSCHTARGVAMNEKALDESSPRYLSGAAIDGWYAPSLRGDPNTGLGRWSEADIVQFLKTGRNAHAVVVGSMSDAFNNSTQFMSDDDLKAIARYLKSLPGTKDEKPWQYQTSANLSDVGVRLKIPGAQTFMAKCSACHGANGRGQGPWIPPLAGAASSMAPENATSINAVLNGSARIVADGVPDAYRMPPYRNQLSDQEIAQVLTFVRTSWGNTGGAVKPDEVKALRDRTNPAGSNVIILQMR